MRLRRLRGTSIPNLNYLKSSAKSRGKKLTRYLYSGIKLQSELTKVTGGTEVTSSFSYTPSGEPYSIHLSTLTSPLSTSHYYHLNAHGDVVSMTDTSGREVVSYSYSPWGTIEKARGPLAKSNPIRYAGYYYDSETGLYYLINRYYDPSLGRFISRDPITQADTDQLDKNQYLYCANDPIDRRDEDGAWWKSGLGSRILYKGCEDGADVLALQGKLNGLNNSRYNCGTPDGIFGKNTRIAVVHYQSDNKLVGDGIVGPKTYLSLHVSSYKYETEWRKKFIKQVRNYKNVPFNEGGGGLNYSGAGIDCSGLGQRTIYDILGVSWLLESLAPHRAAKDLYNNTYGQHTKSGKALQSDPIFLDIKSNGQIAHTIYALNYPFFIEASASQDKVIEINKKAAEKGGQYAKEWKMLKGYTWHRKQWNWVGYFDYIETNWNCTKFN